MTERHRLLVVEDELATAEDLVEMIAALGWEAVRVDNKRDAETRLRSEAFCLVVLDLQIKNESHAILSIEAAGLALLKSIKTNTPGIPVVVVSGHVSEWDAGVGVMRDGAADVMRKPIIDHRRVMDLLRAVFERTGRASHEACSGGTTPAFTLSIPGTRHRQRMDIVVNEGTARLSDRPLRTLLRLMRGKLANKRVHRFDLGEGDAGIKAISVLRQELKSALGDIEIIENDGASNYWLVDTVQIGRFDVEALCAFDSQPVTELAEEIQALIAARSR